MKKILLLCILSVYWNQSFANIAPIALESTAFKKNMMIPKEYTCQGSNLSLPLTWSDPPKNTQSFVLIMQDPDAEGGIWYHWLLVNIPAEARQLPVNMQIPKGTISGYNSWDETGYRGPCPPSGTHHYYVMLYALDTKLQFSTEPSKDDIIHAMQGHIIGIGELIGLYTRD